jgi:hypothetical protein
LKKAGFVFNNAKEGGCFILGGTRASVFVAPPKCLVTWNANDDFGFMNGYLDAKFGMQLPLVSLGHEFPSGQQELM